MAQVAALDFGSYRFKCLLGTTGFQGLQLQRRIIAVNPTGDYDWIENEQLLNAMKKWLAMNGETLAGRTLIVTLPTFYVFTRILRFPFGNVKRLGPVLSMELDGQLPFELSEMLIQYKPYDLAKSHTHVFAAGLSKTYMSKFLATLAPYDPAYVGFEGAVHNGFFELPDLESDKTVGILDLGHRKSTLSIHLEGSLCFTRSMLVGGYHLNKAISDSMKLSLEDADQLKIKEARLPTGNEKLPERALGLFTILREPLEKLTQQIQFSLLNFEISTRIKLETIYLTGGTSQLRGIGSYLESRFPDIRFQPLAEWPSIRRLLPPEEIAFSSATAAILNTGKRTKRQFFSFRIGEFAYHKHFDQLKARARQIAIVAAILLIFPFADVMTKFFLFKQQYTVLHRQLVEAVSQHFPELVPKRDSNLSPRAIARRVEQRQEEITAKMSLVAGISEDASALDVLKTISEAISPTILIDVVEISLSQDKVRMTANTDTIESQGKIVEALKRSQLFSNVISGPISNCTGPGEVCKKFTVDIEIDRTRDKES